MKYLIFFSIVLLLSGCTQNIEQDFQEFYSNESIDSIEHDELDYDYGNYETPESYNKNSVDCWHEELFMKIPCPSNDWEKISESQWKLGNVYYEIFSGIDAPEIVSSGETLFANKPELYSNFNNYASQGVSRHAIPLDKTEAYIHLFNYNEGQYTATELIFIYYRNYYDTEWVMVRTYGPHDELSDNWMPYVYAQEFSEELI